MPDDGQDRVADRDDGAFLAAAAGQAAVAVAEEGVGAGEPGDDLAEGAGQPRVALAVDAVLARPADCLSIGANFAQDTRCAAVGNTVMSRRSRRSSSCAERADTGDLIELVAGAEKGSITSSMRASSAAMSAVRRVDAASMLAQRKAWWSSK